ETPAQHTLGRDMREQNVAEVYRLRRERENQIQAKDILLCDDIITTGATLRECSRILLEGGARSVVCSTLVTVQKSWFNRL
ncbi:MAG: ComF family protein, partial [Clostridium sp.]